MPIGVDDAIAVGVGVLLGWAVTKISEDDDAPTVGDIEILQQVVLCNVTKSKVKVTVSEDTAWYQDDSGLSQVSVTGEDGQTITMYPNEAGSFQEDFEFWVIHRSCRSETIVTFVPQDKSGNQQGYRKVINLTPPHCCDPNQAAVHGCDCTNFNNQGIGSVSLFPGSLESESE